jgi:hypothetical protein
MSKRKGIGGHQSAKAKTVVWLTPPPIIEALGGADSFDLDPCAPTRPPIRTARRVYSRALSGDGLALPWSGRVWLNPPYTAADIAAWLRKLGDHGRGTALIFARTETAAFHREVWERAHGLLFLEGRLHFHDAEGRRAEANAGAPSVLCAYGADDLERLAFSGLKGALVPLLFARGLVVRAVANTWRGAVLDYVRANPGPVRLGDLYRAFARHPLAQKNQWWRAKLRQTLQRAGAQRVGPQTWELVSA